MIIVTDLYCDFHVYELFVSTAALIIREDGLMPIFQIRKM